MLGFRAHCICIGLDPHIAGDGYSMRGDGLKLAFFFSGLSAYQWTLSQKNFLTTCVGCDEQTKTDKDPQP